MNSYYVRYNDEPMGEPDADKYLALDVNVGKHHGAAIILTNIKNRIRELQNLKQTQEIMVREIYLLKQSVSR